MLSSAKRVLLLRAPPMEALVALQRKRLSSSSLFSTATSVHNALLSVSTSPSRVIFRNFHKSSFSFGRRGGASAFEERPRDFSKKQKKRHKKKMMVQRRSEGPTGAQKKMESDLLVQQLEMPETKDLIERSEESVLRDVREMMLPDGLQDLFQQTDEFDNFELETTAHAEDHPHLSDIVMKLTKQLKPDEESTEIMSQPVTQHEANRALITAAKKGKGNVIKIILHHSSELGIPIENTTLSEILNEFSLADQFEEVEYFFDRAISYGITPDSSSWSAYIAASAKGHGHAVAVKILDRVQRLGVEVNVHAYNSILGELVREDKNDEAFDFWMRMKEDGVRANVDSFEIMLQQCIQTHQVERAFNYLDEMKGQKVEYSVHIFEKLFKCCGSAPHWVNGYHDIIFDAMALMEGAELIPTTAVYDNIIFSFGKAGDAAAAEFYFWEMRQKGIAQEASTYESLFGALARAQRVGASKYAVWPRYTRPPEKPKTELQELMLKAGALATNEVLSSRISTEGKLERGKRQYAPLVSTDDEKSPEEAEEELMDELRAKTMNKPSFYEMILEKQRRDRESRDSETGRKIELSLLTMGKQHGPGVVHHMPPTVGTGDMATEEGTATQQEVVSPMSSLEQLEAIVSDDVSLLDDSQTASAQPSAVDLLDNEETVAGAQGAASSLESIFQHDIIPKSEVDKQWQVVLFGRCPDQDVSAPIKQRRSDNLTRADALYVDMLENGVKPDQGVYNAYVSVASEAMRWEKAHEIMDLFKEKHEIVPDATTFKHLIRMHIFMSDIEGSLTWFEDMKARGLKPDKETYGILVESLSHREDLVKATKILEEASDSGIQISNRHIKKLRSRFNKLNLTHPNIYPDPNAWAKEVKEIRANRRSSKPGNRLQHLKSMSYL